MSYIIHKLVCAHCGKVFDKLYMSFGHPSETFDWRWKCSECEGVNVRTIPADSDLSTWLNGNLNDRKVEDV